MLFRLLRLAGLIVSLNCSLTHAGETQQPALKLEKAGSAQVYFSFQGKPLLSFGGLSDFMFYAGQDAYDYELWADWAQEHGINHVRAYPPLSWKHVEKFVTENGGDLDKILFPYEETEPGNRIFDLNRFNAAYWARFRRQCEYLESKGIILHLLMWNGWQLRAADTRGSDASSVDWDGHFFNPANNSNAFTGHLGGSLSNRFHLYHSVTDEKNDLAKAQQRWFQKLIQETADLGNVYYDLIHELGEHQGQWSKTQAWIDSMTTAIGNAWKQQNPGRELILGMDTGGLKAQQRDWIFTRPYFNILVFGKAHSVKQACNWRIQYRKPYIPQESWDDNGQKYSYIHPEMRTHTRKYMWKFMMAKAQQLDLYMKPRRGFRSQKQAAFPHNYDPRAWNLFEKDAEVLRSFSESLVDYGNLWFWGEIDEGPGKHQYLLSSSHEAVLYFSSGTGQEQVAFPASTVRVKGLPLMEDPSYIVDIIDPKGGKGLIERRRMALTRSEMEIRLPPFVDDIALHVFSDKVIRPKQPPAMRAITQGPKFHWFGYYDKLQFDPTGRYVLGMEVDFEHRTPRADDVIKIGMVDLEQGDRWIELGESRAWGWQQGCMLQWIPRSNSEVIWNDRQGDRFVSHILDVFTDERRTIPYPIYTLSPDGRTALSADFARIQSLRPGYGYAGLADPYGEELAPSRSGIQRVDLQTGQAQLIVTHAQIRDIPYTENPTSEVTGSKHWFNHLLFNPDGSRFIFLERWRIPGSTPARGYWGVRTRMFTAAPDGSDIHLLDPYGHTSHFIWRDPRFILAWAWHPSHKSRYYLFEDQTENIRVFDPAALSMNGHNSYLPGHEWILNDTNGRRPQPLYLYSLASGKRLHLGDFWAGPEYQGEWRCDLHPRYSPDGSKIVIDSPHAGGRQLWLIDISAQ